MKALILIVVFQISNALNFPEVGEDPLIGVLDFRRKLYILNPSTGEKVEEITLQGPRGGATVCLDFDYRDNFIYYTNVFNNKVYSLKTGDNENNQTILLEGGLWSPEGLAYDWIHKNLYLCNWRNGEIILIKPETGERKVLINTYRPRDIEVDPRTGWLYYIGGWEETARLVRCGLDGQNAENLTNILKHPYTISLDYDENKLYWSEVLDENGIYTINTDGTNPGVFYKKPYHVFKETVRYMSVGKEYVYWTTTRRVMRRRKHNGTDNERFSSLEHYGNYNIQKDVFCGLLVLDGRKQPTSINLCGDNNGGCSHFCLPSPVELHQDPPFTCHCPDGMTLEEDLRTCI